MQLKTTILTCLLILSIWYGAYKTKEASSAYGKLAESMKLAAELEAANKSLEKIANEIVVETKKAQGYAAQAIKIASDATEQNNLIHDTWARHRKTCPVFDIPINKTN